MNEQGKQEVKKILSNFTKKELLKFGSDFNNWKFPDELGEYKPTGFDEMPDYIMNKDINIENKSDDCVFRMFVDTLKELLTEKERLKYHHIHVLKRTPFQFYKFWYKRKIEKFLGIGFYSKKRLKMMKEILSEIAKENNQEQLRGVYNKK